MDTIGSRETALMLNRHFNHPSRQDVKTRAPKGFVKVGEGCYRTAYLEKATNLVYKVGYYKANVSEAYNSRRFRSRSTRGLGFDLYIPRTRTYAVPCLDKTYWNNRECVSVQEFAVGAKPTICLAGESWRDDARCTCEQDPCYAEVIERVMEWSSLEDMHPYNILHVKDTNTYWLIDIAT